ncbi:MAG: hypothetical protein M1816_005300 [Peltula sp. TS41687]|nr:MAG: hypothetical protein M1816_005300 [Peltula sp. TS41687]
MPSSRRWRVLAVILVTLIVVVLYFSADARKASSRDFYSSTVQKLNQQHNAEHAEQARRMEQKSSSGGERVEKGQGKGKGKGEDVVVKVASDAVAQDKGVVGEKEKKKAVAVADAETETETETDEEHRVEVELGAILKRSPIIIFSKTYCPYSKKAKAIFSKYSIVPAPFVVELDEHPLGRQLQDALHRTTGRRTVPNVLISGKSIGGGDDVAELDASGELMGKVRSMGGKRIMEARLRDGGGGGGGGGGGE